MVSLKAPLAYRLGSEFSGGYGLMLRKGDVLREEDLGKGKLGKKLVVVRPDVDSKSGESAYSMWLRECGLVVEGRHLMNPSNSRDLLGWTYNFSDSPNNNVYGARLLVMDVLSSYLKEHARQFGFYYSRSPMYWEGDVLSVVVEILPGDGYSVSDEDLRVYQASLEVIGHYVVEVFQSKVSKGINLSIDFHVISLINACLKYPKWGDAREELMSSMDDESSLYDSFLKDLESSVDGDAGVDSLVKSTPKGNVDGIVKADVKGNIKDGVKGSVGGVTEGIVKDSMNGEGSVLTSRVRLSPRGVIAAMLVASLWPVTPVLSEMLGDLLVGSMQHRESLSDFQRKLEKVSAHSEFGLLHNEFKGKGKNAKVDDEGVDSINEMTSKLADNEILRKGGYRGYRVVVKGPRDGARRTFRMIIRGGILPLSSVSVPVAHSQSVACTKIGTLGVSVTYAY